MKFFNVSWNHGQDKTFDNSNIWSTIELCQVETLPLQLLVGMGCYAVKEALQNIVRFYKNNHCANCILKLSHRVVRLPNFMLYIKLHFRTRSQKQPVKYFIGICTTHSTKLFVLHTYLKFSWQGNCYNISINNFLQYLYELMNKDQFSNMHLLNTHKSSLCTICV